MCTHCLNSFTNFAFRMIICTSLLLIVCISLLWIYYLEMESVIWPKYLTTCKFCDFLIFKGSLYLSYNQLTGTLPTEIKLTQFGRLLCTHCLNYLMDFAFCMIIRISVLWMFWRWRMSTDHNISPLAFLVTFLFQKRPRNIT